jgi:hypothetical protein
MQGKLLLTLKTLVSEDVGFILVGGLAAVLRGAPVSTFDVDIVFSQEPANIAKLLTALESLDAVFRMQPWRKIRPNESHLLGSGHLNLQTKYGYLDVLTNIGDNVRYDNLISLSTPMLIDESTTIQVLNLKTLIQLKEQLNGEKDRAMLPILRRTLFESEK